MKCGEGERGDMSTKVVEVLANKEDIVVIQCVVVDSIETNENVVWTDEVDEELPKSVPNVLDVGGIWCLQQYYLEFGTQPPNVLGNHTWEWYVNHMFPTNEQQIKYMIFE